ncbi:MAG: dienelactone hydrolase family protein, partial [Rhodobiaceae bacterium]
LIHIAGEDEFVPKEAQSAIADALAAHSLAEVHIYDGQDHAFARHNGMHYDAQAAARAHGRTLTMFAETIG